MTKLNLLHLICAFSVLFNFPASARLSENLTGPTVFNDELSHEFYELIEAPDNSSVEDLQEQIADEIFNEPLVARAKVVELCMLRDDYLERQPLTTTLRKRLKGLETQIKARIAQDHRARLTSDALLLTATVLTSASLYASLGMSELGTILDGMEELEDSSSRNLHRLNSTYFYTRAMPSHLALESHAELNSETVLGRDLQALGLSPSQVSDLRLEKISPRAQGYTQFDRSNLPGLSYALVGHPVRMIFAMTPSLFSNARAWLRTKPLSVNEASDIIRDLEGKDSKHGGQEFLILVDPETREAFPTRLTADQLRAHSKAWQQGFKYTTSSPWSDLRNRNDLDLFALEGRYLSARLKARPKKVSNSATP